MMDNFAVIQTHSLIFLSSDLGVIALSWSRRWDSVPADDIPGTPSQRGLHRTEAKKPFRPEKQPRGVHRNGRCCSFLECGIESRGQSSRCQPPHRLKPQSRALVSPSLISHISDSCVCLLRRARLQNRFLPSLQSSAAAE